MQELIKLIDTAIKLANNDNYYSYGTRLWKAEGGRPCPLHLNDNCTQTVYIDLVTGEYDYGGPGGPGHDECVHYCQNIPKNYSSIQ